MGVVDGFEAVEIQKNQRERAGIFFLELLGEILLKARPVSQAGDGVGGDLRQQLLVLGGQNFGLLLGAEHEIDQCLIGFGEDGRQIDLLIHGNLKERGLLAGLRSNRLEQLIAIGRGQANSLRQMLKILDGRRDIIVGENIGEAAGQADDQRHAAEERIGMPVES